MADRRPWYLDVLLMIGLGVASVAPAQAQTFVAAPGSPFAVLGTNPRAIAVGDFNEDGLPDVVTANVNSSNVSLMLGNSAGTLAPAPGSPFPTFTASHSTNIETHPQGIAVADFNNDGHLDVVTVNPSFFQGIGGGVSVLFGNGAGGFTVAPGSPLPGGFKPTSVAVGDFNEDGNADLAITNTVFLTDTFQNEVEILLGRADGRFDHGTTILDRELPYHRPLNPFWAGPPRSITVSDFNDDGNADLVFVTSGTNDVSVWLGDGAGAFAAAPNSPIPIGRFVESVAVGDFDEDARLDLAVIGSNSVSVLLGRGAGSFAPATGSPLALSGSTSEAAVGDFNADGHADLAIGGFNMVFVLRGSGTGTFTQPPGSPYLAAGQTVFVAAADFNGDGRSDIAGANIASNNVSVLLSVPDTTAPTIHCSVPDETVWYGSDVTVMCTASDSGSGLADASDASFQLSTTLAIGTETSNAVTNSRQVCDVAGNCATAGPYNFSVDKRGPSLSCLAIPTFVLNQAGASVSAVVTDSGSGPLASPVSVPVDTSSAGSKSASVTGYDTVGNETSTLCSYQVDYTFSGFVAPVNNAPAVNTAKAGRTYPLKWQLRDADGNFISALSSVVGIVVQPTSCSTFASTPTDAMEATATGGAGLRYDTSANSYVYNWSTPAQGCYTLFVQLDSGQVALAFFNLR